ncbi:hypothetical protein QQS21_012130 [Conoideocrella luteorostrata]|uniref:Uncharacterized protein n=1 Tax=Conoideocrella luteorostrata TaxID=1105319 RepID=A0AAJ0FSQ4_9HYPO|nr:hypothetical protein QQS21_012130 [Conoideocrella luteorostrata]
MASQSDQDDKDIDVSRVFVVCQGASLVGPQERVLDRDEHTAIGYDTDEMGRLDEAKGLLQELNDRRQRLRLQTDSSMPACLEQLTVR